MKPSRQKGDDGIVTRKNREKLVANVPKKIASLKIDAIPTYFA
jgi:hypothetical protein